MNLAPIVLFTYNRPIHTLKTLEALKKNTLSNESTLYIFCDGPKKNASEETVQKIKETQKIIEQKQWCKDIIIIKSEINKGLANSIISGLNSIFEKFEKVIVLEDDILTSPYFLQFMNEGLNIYKKSYRIKSIAGYIEPLKTKKEEAILLPIGYPWGWATWKRTFDEIDWNIDNLMDQINALPSHKIKEFDHAINYYGMLKAQKEGKINSWYIRFHTSCFLNNGLHLKPTKSLTKNIGFDNDGTHCTDSHPIHSYNNYTTNSIKIPHNLTTINIQFNNKILKLYKKQYLLDKINYRKNQFIRVINRLKSTIMKSSNNK